jgi:hypothetical protein
MASPFGIAFYTSLDQLADANEMAPGVYSVTAPSPHPAFKTYLVRATPGLGVVWIKGLGEAIENDAFGGATRAAVDRLKEQLALRYKEPRKLDFLMHGSIWEDPKYWMMGLSANERYYSYTWDASGAGALPEDIASVYVGASAMSSDSAMVVIEYASRKLPQADAEDDRRLSDLL